MKRNRSKETLAHVKDAIQKLIIEYRKNAGNPTFNELLLNSEVSQVTWWHVFKGDRIPSIVSVVPMVESLGVNIINFLQDLQEELRKYES